MLDLLQVCQYSRYFWNIYFMSSLNVHPDSNYFVDNNNSWTLVQRKKHKQKVDNRDIKWSKQQRKNFKLFVTRTVIDSNHFWPDWSLLLAKSTWCLTPSRWQWPQTCTSRESARNKRMVNALTRIEPDLVPLWTNLDRAELYQLY